MLRHMADDLTLGAAAKAIGVSADTLRRWDAAGKLRTVRDDRNRRLVPGVVRSVEVDGVMALVEIEAGPFLVTAAVTRDSIDELGLAPGVRATAAVKATSVMVSR